MITSFVVLPEFMRGIEMKGAVLHSNSYRIPENPYVGRNFFIPKIQYRKVKLTIPDNTAGIVYAVVGMIFLPEQFVGVSGGVDNVAECIRLGRIDQLKCCTFIPLYITEYMMNVEEELLADVNMFNTPRISPGRTSMYIPGINDLFTGVLGIQRVTSLASIWYWELRNCDINIECIPQDVLDEDLDPDFATMSVCQDIGLAELFTEYGNGELLDSMIERCCVRKSRYPMTVKGVLRMRSMAQLIPLIDSTYQMHPIARCVDTALSESPLWNQIIYAVDDDTPRVKTTNNGSMREVLDLVSNLPSCDFRLLCGPVKSDFQSLLVGPPLEMFNPFTFGTSVSTSPVYSRLCDALREESGYMFNYLSSIELRVVGSYLEDMFIYDDQNLIQYIDLFWWNLAACDGLFNEYLLH